MKAVHSRRPVVPGEQPVLFDVKALAERELLAALALQRAAESLPFGSAFTVRAFQVAERVEQAKQTYREACLVVRS